MFIKTLKNTSINKICQFKIDTVEHFAFIELQESRMKLEKH